MKKKSFKKKHNWIYIIIAAIILCIDISSKNWIMNHLKLYETQKIFSILNFFHIHNYGVAFSFLSNQGKSQRWLLSIISACIILVFIGILIKSKKKEKKQITAYSLIIAGALGNLVDRLFYGFVIDFIDLHIYDWHFATFNIADCGIFFGILMLT